MRIRQLLLSTVMCGGVALLSSASSAQTAPKVTFKPQGDWAVTRMAAKGPGKAPYCTMARRFADNVILTFARNAHDETSVAMDFPPKTLARGQSYYVTLDAGKNEKRAFDVTPVSDKAMVIRLGNDAKFHTALAQTGLLNVDVAGLLYEFNVPDMAKGDQDLSGCVGSIVEPAAGEGAKPAQMAQADNAHATAAPSVRPPAADILSAPVTNNAMDNAPQPVLHKDDMPSAKGPVSSAPSPVAPLAVAAASSQGDLEGLREENLRLKNALERERREYEERFMRESAGSSQVSEVMEKVKLLEKENSDLKYQLADARSMVKTSAASKAPAEAPQCPASDPKAGAEISVLREENARLKADIAAQKTAMVQLEMQAKAGEAKVAAVDEGMIIRLQARIDELAAQNTKLQAEVVSAKESSSAAADAAISVSQLRSIETQLQTVEKERDTLRAQIEKMGDSQESSLLKLSGSDWSLEQATRRYNEAEREIRRLGMQLEQSRSQCAAEKKEIEYMLFDPAIATEQQISKLSTLENEVVMAKAALAKKDQEVSARIEDYEQKIAALEADSNKSSVTDSELAALRAELEISKRDAAARVAEAKRLAEAQVSAEKEQMAQRIATLEARVASAVQPAAGTPQAAVQDMDVASVNAVVPSMAPSMVSSVIEAEPVGAPLALRPGQVSTRVEAPAAPIALAPKSAVASDAFQPTKAVVAPIVQQAVAQQSAQQPVMAAVAASGNMMTAEALSGQLRSAGLPVNGPVKKVDNAANGQLVAYSWDANGLFGSAEQKQMANAEQFMTYVQQYLDKTKARCAGDFAASPVPTLTPPAGMQVASYEIACVSADGTGATAALAFYGKNNLFTTVAHESNMDTMDMAMDARDRVLASVIK